MGETIDGRKALEIGLVTRLYDSENLYRKRRKWPNTCPHLLPCSKNDEGDG